MPQLPPLLPATPRSVPAGMPPKGLLEGVLKLEGDARPGEWPRCERPALLCSARKLGACIVNVRRLLRPCHSKSGCVARQLQCIYFLSRTHKGFFAVQKPNLLTGPEQNMSMQLFGGSCGDYRNVLLGVQVGLHLESGCSRLAAGCKQRVNGTLNLLLPVWSHRQERPTRQTSTLLSTLVLQVTADQETSNIWLL